MRFFLVPFLYIGLLAIGLQASGLHAQQTDNPMAEDADNAAYWTSVFSGATVLKIDIYLDSKKWNAMEPAINDHRRRGFNQHQGQDASRSMGSSRQSEYPQDGPPAQGPGLGMPPGAPPMMPEKMSQESGYQYVSAKVVINGEVLENVGLRFKGNSSYRSSMRSMKRPLKIDTDRFVDDQKFHGRTKLNLSISFKDPAYLREKLGYGIYRAAGVPSPGVGWSTIKLHFEDTQQTHDLGPYVMIEQVDKAYMRRTFGDKAADGVLLKPEIPEWQYMGQDPSAYEVYDIKLGGENQEMVLRFADLVRLINEAPDDVFRAKIGSLLDLDMFAGYLAATSLLVNLDSYIGMIHNYYVFIDPQDGRARLLPWDINEAFGGFSFGAPIKVLANWSIARPWVIERPLLTRLFQLPEFKERYRNKIVSLMAGAFTKVRLEALIDKYLKVVAPLVEETQGPQEVREMHLSIAGGMPEIGNGQRAGRGAGGVPALIPFIMQRIDSVQAQLAGTEPGEIITEGRRGPKRDRGGRGRPDNRRGDPRRGQSPQRDGPAPSPSPGPGSGTP